MTHGPIVGSLHDNYQDIYQQCPSFPQRIMRCRAVNTASAACGPAGRRTCCAPRRSWIASAATGSSCREHLNPSAMFVDTTTASPLYECYDPAHPMSRADDAHWKCEAIKVFKADGVLFGTEETRDFAAALVDWYETRHHHHTGTTIPLWSLVYHDACISTRYLSPMGEDDTKIGAQTT